MLGAKRLAKISDVFEQRRASNSEIAELDCLTLTDRFEIVRCLPELRKLLRFSSKRDAERLKKELQEVRDCLAHGGDLLTAANGNASRAAEIVKTVSSFGDAVGEAANRA